MGKVSEAIKYIRLLGENQEEAKNYFESFSYEEQCEILITAKKIIAHIHIREGANMQNACYECKYRGSVPGDAHSCCNNHLAIVVGDEHGIKNGWFFYPYNFDPIWLRYCDGFEKEKQG